MTYVGPLPNLVRLYEFKLDQHDSLSPCRPFNSIMRGPQHEMGVQIRKTQTSRQTGIQRLWPI